jgi:hypothetical protein
MEEQTVKRLDSVLEDELARGYRIKDLPTQLQQQLEAECGLKIAKVRLTRLNPSRRRKIAQVVQRQYHRDLRDEDLLSHEQILKLVQERGEWSAAMDAEMGELQRSTSREMGELFVDGIIRDNWSAQIIEASDLFRTRVQEAMEEELAAEVLARFARWIEYSPDEKDAYTEKFAAEQGREAYSVDVDLQRLLEKAPDLECVDALNTIDDLRDRLYRYMVLQKNRMRLMELQIRHAKIFSDSVEQRRDNAEEMARLYFTVETVDEDGKPTGPLTKEFEQLWDFPESVVQWFLVEVYFFLNGIPDEAREFLQNYGFLAAEAGETISENGESEQSEESPAPLSSNPDSSPVEAMAYASSE